MLRLILCSVGSGLLKHFDNSHVLALMQVFPEHDWVIDRFNHLPSNFWNSSSNRLSFLGRLGRKLNFTTMEHWKQVSKQDFIRNGGSGLLTYHDNSIFNILSTYYPQHNWNSTSFRSSSFSMEQHLTYFDDLAKRLDYHNLDDWYRIQTSDFDSKGTSILKHYGHSYIKALFNLYPHHKWDITQFRRIPYDHWQDPQHRLQFFNELSSKLHLNSLDDWYRVPKELVLRNGGGNLLNYFGGSYMNALMSTYPHHPWNFNTAINHSSKSQSHLFQLLRRIVPAHVDIWMNYVDPHRYVYPSGKPIEIDVFIQDWKLAIEYQGHQHFESQADYVFNNPIDQQCRDEVKRRVLEEHGLTLVEINYHWDGTER